MRALDTPGAKAPTLAELQCIKGPWGIYDDEWNTGLIKLPGDYIMQLG